MKKDNQLRILALVCGIPLLGLIALFACDGYVNSLPFMRLNALELRPDYLAFERIVEQTRTRSFSLFSTARQLESLFEARGEDGSSILCYSFGDSAIPSKFGYALVDFRYFRIPFAAADAFCVPDFTIKQVTAKFLFRGMNIISQLLLSVLAPLGLVCVYLILRHAERLLPARKLK